LKRFQLSISGCIGPCDVPNVVEISSETGLKWLGNITKFNQYCALLEWAMLSTDAGHLLDLSRELKDHLLRVAIDFALTT
jgi:hypothetical protein